MTAKEIRRRLVGRKIVGFEANAFRDGIGLGRHDKALGPQSGTGGRWTYDPVLILDDGTRVSFFVHETEVDDYGIHPVITPRRQP